MVAANIPERIGIVGLGLMGASLALAIRRARPDLRLVGVDTDPEVVSRALELDYVTEAGEGLGLVRDCDLVVLAVPIWAMDSVLPSLRGHRGVITDVCSTKVVVMSWASDAGVDLVGGHPMCGRELSGFEAARADLFEAAPWLLTREDPVVVALVRLVGAKPMLVAAGDHDRLVAGVSHAAFMLSTAYMLAVFRSADWPRVGELAAGGFRDMTRLAAGDPAMYEFIALHNRENMDAWLERVEEILAEMRRRLHVADPALGHLFQEAKQARNQWAGGRS